MNRERTSEKPVVTADYLREINDAFTVYDSNHKGYLTKKEVCAVIKNIGYNPTDTDCQNMEFEIEHELDGKVGFDNFMEFLSSHYNSEEEEQIFLESFRSFDVDNKGIISSQDIREILMNVMEKCPEEDKHQILRVFHLDEDRSVTYDDFKKMIMPSGSNSS